jgi:hypothetical protein
MQARTTSIIVPKLHGHPVGQLDLALHRRHVLPHQLEFLRRAHLRHHDLRADLDAGADAGRGRFQHRADLHRVDLRVGETQAHAAVAQHRVHLLQRPRLAQDRVLARDHAVDQPGLGQVTQAPRQLAVADRAGSLGEHFHAARCAPQVLEALQVLLQLSLGRQELVDRRIEQADRHRVRRHRLEDADEVAALDRQQPVERGTTLLRRVGDDHVDDDRQPVR